MYKIFALFGIFDCLFIKFEISKISFLNIYS